MPAASLLGRSLASSHLPTLYLNIQSKVGSEDRYILAAYKRAVPSLSIFLNEITDFFPQKLQNYAYAFHGR